MNPDSRNTQLQKPARRSDGTVRDVLNSWPVKRPTYTLAPRLNVYLLAIVLILILTLIFSTVLFICAREEFFDFDVPFSRPTDKEHESNNNGGVANNDGERPFADGVSGNALLPWAENVKIIPENSIHASYAALADLSNGGRGIGNQVEALLINPLSRWLFDNGVISHADVVIEAFDVTARPPCIRCSLSGAAAASDKEDSAHE